GIGRKLPRIDSKLPGIGRRRRRAAGGPAGEAAGAPGPICYHRGMSPRAHRLVLGLLVFVASTFAGIYFATQLVIAYPPPIRRPLGDALAINLTYYYLWGLSVPAVIWVARRFRFERGTWVFSFVIHSI